MFTGIIEAVGNVVEIEEKNGDARLTIEADPSYIETANLGDCLLYTSDAADE